MPRIKTSKPNKIPQKDEDDKSDFTPATKKRRRSSLIGAPWRRKIHPPGETNFPTLTISLEWAAPKSNIIPTILQIADIDDNISVSADDLPIFISFDMAQTLRHSLKNMQIIFKCSTKTKLKLYVAIKTLPLVKAQSLVEFVFHKDYSEYDNDYTTADSGWTDFFKEIETIQRSRKSPELNMQLEELRPILRDYQAAAVDWMLERERSPGSLNLSWLSEVSDTFKTKGHTLMYNKYSKSLYSEFSSVPLSSGGILADEMGLGKTVITLALILHNKRIDFDSFWEMIPKTSELCETEEMDEDSSENDEPSQRQLNQEGSLSVNEQLKLIPSTGQGKGVLRSQLQAWYESQLSDYRLRPQVKNNRRNQFKCTCGDEKGRKKPIVKCISCKLYQHEKCCGFNSEFQYICPSCWRTQKSVPSQTTLIIVPPAIQTQWVNEVKLHAPSLKIFVYNGIRDAFVQPLVMADHDVVITTYVVLRSETLYTVDAGERSLRNEGRFLRSSSPLERVSWWRIVCDEAQLVESDLSLVRKMTNLLQAVHRWCVTGTPIQRGVADLFYLTSFMGIGVFDDKSTWNDFLLEPYIAKCKTPLLSVLSQVFWRSTKEVVAASLPEQTFQLHNLKFSAIEEIFYMQQHAQSATKFSEGLVKSGVDTSLPLDSIDKSTLKRILQPLLNVRQACTHAQVVSGISINSASGAANLAELSDYLYKKAKQECEEALRCHVAALNGLAGLYWFSNVSEALDCYRSVFRLADECRGAVQVDTLQRIHALTNAALILETNPGVAPPTLRDQHLQTDAEELEKKYLTKSEDMFASSQVQTENLSKEVVTIREDFESDPSSWWNPVIIGLYDYEKELIDKLTEELHSNDPTEKIAAKSFLSKIVTLRSVEITIRNWWQSLEKCYKHVKLAMRTLNSTHRKTLMEEALQCHLRSPEERFQCTLCSVERSLQDLECELFATTRKVTKKREKGIDGSETKGSWKPHNVERTLSTVFSFARGKINLDSWCVRDGRQHLKLLEAMKKEFKQVRAEWTALNHCIHAEDELTMAKQRVRLSVEEQPNNRISKTLVVPKGESLLELNPYQIPQMMKVFEVERDTALSDFNKKKGRMMYLQNLSKDRNVAVDPCPICKNALEQQWCVLYCGHCLCFQCMQMLLNGRPKGLKCPVCREFTNDTDVGFVDIVGNAEASDIEVKGDYSTKVDNIIRQVLRLLKEDSTVKILIFSTWNEVLKILSQALEANQVSFVTLPSNKHQEVLSKFLDKSQGVTALLLPLAWGSKGLNLIEATHVFLVEPILNPAEELQAIGRVHRIGQTRPTVVHRFIVNRTIEEKIFAAVSEAKDTWSNKTVSLDDLKRLFVIPAVKSDKEDPFIFPLV